MGCLYYKEAVFKLVIIHCNFYLLVTSTLLIRKKIIMYIDPDRDFLHILIMTHLDINACYTLNLKKRTFKLQYLMFKHISNKYKLHIRLKLKSPFQCLQTKLMTYKQTYTMIWPNFLKRLYI